MTDTETPSTALTFTEVKQLEVLMPLTCKTPTDRVLMGRVKKQLQLTDEERERLGYVEHKNGRWEAKNREETASFEKHVVLGEMGYAFVREVLQEAIDTGVTDDNEAGWNVPSIWGLFEKFGKLQQATDRVVEQEKIPAADFMLDLLEKTGHLDDIDIR